jgi:hypothetical protein
LQAEARAERSAAVQLVEVGGGVVITPGLQPPYGAGQVAPGAPQAPFWHVSFWLAQLSQSAPKRPHRALFAPATHWPLAVQQPPQLSGPQWAPS